MKRPKGLEIISPCLVERCIDERSKGKGRDYELALKISDLEERSQATFYFSEKFRLQRSFASS